MLVAAARAKTRVVRMNDAETNNLLRGASSIYPPIVLAVLAALVVYAAQAFGPTARQLPTLIGTITLILALLDLVSRLPGTPGRLLRLALGAGFQERELDFEPAWRAELAEIAWLAGVIAAILAVGLLVTIPVFVFAYSRLQGDWPLWLSALTAGAVVTVVALVFEVALDYELYRGLLFAEST
jgi:uncharacterized membrane protein